MPLKPPGAPMPRKLMLLLSIAAVLVLSSLWRHYAAVGNTAIARPVSSDFYKFYVSAKRVRDGLSMYWVVPPRERRGDPCHPDTPDADRHLNTTPNRLNLGGNHPCLGPNLNPPVFMIFAKPLSLLPYAYAWWTWAAFSAICGAWAAALISGLLSGNLAGRLTWTLTLCAALFAYYPTLTSFSLGQLGLPLLLLLTQSWLNGRNGRERYAGAWLGLAIGFKPFIAILLLGWVVKRRRQVVLHCLLTIAAVLTIGAILGGFEAYREYIIVGQDVTWTASNWNGSWFGLFDRAFSGHTASIWPHNKPTSKLLATGCALMTLAASLWAITRSSGEGAMRDADKIYLLLTPAALLVSPLGWVYYFPALVVCILIIWSGASKLAQAKVLRLLLILLMAITMIPTTLSQIPTPQRPSIWWGLDSLYWYALILAWLIGMSYCIFNERVPEKKRPTGRFTGWRPWSR